jgi:hypothetical protein
MVGGVEQKLARVTTFKVISDGASNVIGMPAVQETGLTRFIRIEWILQSIYLEPTFDQAHPDYWYVNDILDMDTFLLFLSISQAGAQIL